MKKIYLNSILSLLIATMPFIAGVNTVFSQDGEGGWTQLTSMSTPRFLGASCYLDGKIYTTGGLNFGGWLGSAEVYDIEQNEWISLANMHEIRLGGTMEIVDNKIYAVGGSANTNPSYTNVEEYDAHSDTWKVLGNTPETCWGHSSCVLENKVYVMGGYNINVQAKDSCHKYDPNTDNWTSISPMLFKRSHAACGTYENKIYVFGGTEVFDQSTVINKAEVYDPATNSWDSIADLPVPMFDFIAISYEEHRAILLMDEQRVYAYYPLRNTYVRMKDMPQRNGSSAVNSDQYVYIIGGETQGGGILPELWRFNLDSLKEAPLSVEYNKDENTHFSLLQVSPNPLIESAKIYYELYIPGEVRLEIYNFLGKQLAVLVNQKQVSGTYTVNWNAEGVTTGIYFCKLEVDGNIQIQKLIVLR